jgi:hypothetical protein
LAGFSRSARIVGVVLLSAADALAGQSRATGHVVRVTAGDTIPLPGIAVVLHQVGQSAQGPMDTVLADRRGRFAFRFAADTTAAYLLSARYGGIEYFSSPIASSPGRPDTTILVVVADTSSAAPVVLRQRTIVISYADESGTRTVLDWFVLSNAGNLTRVSPDTLHPSWGAPLPPEAQSVELANSRLSQFSLEALAFRRDSVLILAPLSPGDKELMLQYRIPGSLRSFVIPPAGVTDSVFVLLEGGKGAVVSNGFASRDMRTIENRTFQRWAGVVRGTDPIRVSLSAPPFSTGQLLGLLATLAALGFVTLGIRLARRLVAAPLASAGPSPDWLADAAARLDVRYAGAEAITSPEEWSRYLAERARLKAELERALAVGRHS